MLGSGLAGCRWFPVTLALLELNQHGPGGTLPASKRIAAEDARIRLYPRI